MGTGLRLHHDGNWNGGVQTVITPDLLQELNVTVLSPDDIELPHKKGLLAWLKEHPGGYVQIEEPLSVSTDGLTSLFWVTVACVAQDRETAQALSDRAHPLIAGTPTEPTNHPMVTDSRARQTSPGVYVCRRAYEVTTLNTVVVN